MYLTIRMMQTIMQKSILILDHQALCRFVLSFGIWQHFMFLVVCNQSGVISCTSVDIYFEPTLFIQMVAGFGFASLETLGYDSHILYLDLLYIDRNRHTMTLRTGLNHTYSISRRIFVSHMLCGRATCVFEVCQDKKVMVMKDGWIARKA